jgi:hypothetical protein
VLEYFYWRKTIFRIFFLYEDAVVRCPSIAEQCDDILDLRRFRTVITQLEKVISLGDE